MKIKIIKSKDLFTITDFPRPIERFEPKGQSARDSHIYEKIALSCPNCKQAIEFKESDFQKHLKNNKTNLSDEDAKIMTKVAKSIIKNKLYSLDFYCPKCNAPICIYYNADVAGRGEIFYRLAFVGIGMK